MTKLDKAIDKGIITANNNNLTVTLLLKLVFLLIFPHFLFCCFPRFCMYFFLAVTLNNIALDSMLIILPKHQSYQANWDEVYGEIEIEISLNRLQGPGNTVKIKMFVAVKIVMFVNASFSDNLVTWCLHTLCLHTRILISINNASIYWYSKG